MANIYTYTSLKAYIYTRQPRPPQNWEHVFLFFCSQSQTLKTFIIYMQHMFSLLAFWQTFWVEPVSHCSQYKHTYTYMHARGHKCRYANTHTVCSQYNSPYPFNHTWMLNLSSRDPLAKNPSSSCYLTVLSKCPLHVWPRFLHFFLQVLNFQDTDIIKLSIHTNVWIEKQTSPMQEKRKRKKSYYYHSRLAALC